MASVVARGSAPTRANALPNRSWGTASVMTGTIIANAGGTKAIAVVKRKLSSSITAKSASAMMRILRPPRPQNQKNARKRVASLNGKAMVIATTTTTCVAANGTAAIAVASQKVTSIARSANV